MGLAAWYLVADDRAVNATAIGGLRHASPVSVLGSTACCRIWLWMFAGAGARSLPQGDLRLTLLLFAFGIPILALILTFVGLVAGWPCSASRRRSWSSAPVAAPAGT